MEGGGGGGGEGVVGWSEVGERTWMDLSYRCLSTVHFVETKKRHSGGDSIGSFRLLWRRFSPSSPLMKKRRVSCSGDFEGGRGGWREWV